MIELKNISLIAVACVKIEETIEALKRSCSGIKFNEVVFVSHFKPDSLPKEYKFVKIEMNRSIDDWNKKIFYDLHTYFDSEFCLLIHSDGYVVNPDKWNDDFLKYDYIGSPWTEKVAVAIQGGRNQELVRVGNSVSIRSKRLCELPSKINIPWVKYNGDYNEDTQICAHNRKTFLENGITFAPIELAVHFGREDMMPENENIEPFIFHRFFKPGHPNFKYIQE